MNNVEVTNQKIKESIPVNSSPLEVQDLTSEFYKYLNDKSKSAFNHKCWNMVLDYYKLASGKLIIPKEYKTLEERCVQDQYLKLIGEIDPQMTRHAGLCLYGSIQLKCKYKDRDKLQDKIALKKIAELFNQLIDQEYILPVVFSPSPIKIQLCLIDDTNNNSVVLQDGKFVPAITNYQTYMEAKIREGFTGKQPKIYTPEEVDELVYSVIYHFYVYPTLKFNELAGDSKLSGYHIFPDKYNEIIGTNFFVKEGELPRLVIEL